MNTTNSLALGSVTAVDSTLPFHKFSY